MEERDSITHSMVAKTDQTVVDTNELRDHIADFDDFYRPLRNYLYWEPHCFDIPLCWSTRALFDSLDGIDELTDKLHAVNKDTQTLDSLLPQVTGLLPLTIDTLKTTRALSLTMNQTMSANINQM